MGRKSWTILPAFLIFSAVMLAMSFVSYGYNKLIFIVELVVSVVSMAVVLFFCLRYRKYLFKTVTRALDSMNTADGEYLNNFSFPVVVVGKKEEILVYNDAFYDGIVESGKVLGNYISAFIGENSLEKIIKSDGVDVEISDKKYTVYSNKVKKGTALYFIDNTYYKQVEQKYNDTRLSIAVAVFDNKDDFYNKDDETGDYTVLSVENLLQRWASAYIALYKKLSDGKYILLFEDKAVKKIIENKFEVLDKVREIKVDSMSATVSIGVSRNCKDLRSGLSEAKKALEMALGRGGDQVALVDGGNYEFFGGYSKGVEKQDKVRARIVASALNLAISESDKVFIMGHRFSDLDCIGAGIGLYSAVTKHFRKEAYIVVNSQNSMAKELIDMYSKFAPGAFMRPEVAIKNKTQRSLLIVVDTHSPDFVESRELYSSFENVVVIDHHRKMVGHIDNAKIFFHEPTASSACEMCTQLISYFAEEAIAKREAEALLSGIMLDTKNFVIKTGVNTFEAAAFLRKRGADTVEVRSLFSSTIDIYKEKYKLVSNAEIHNNCAVSVQETEVCDVRLVAAQAADELLLLKDVMASFVIFITDGNVVNISARSYGKINVQLVMEQMGGGGHLNMAATQLKNTDVNEAKKRLLEIIKDIHKS